jgi:hypothetical protein
MSALHTVRKDKDAMSDTATPNPTPSSAPAPEVAPVAAPIPRKTVKTRLPYQRACNEKDEKGKLCAGHLKRWYGFGDEIKRQYGADAEVYRCEFCKLVYLPAPGYESRSGTLQF